MDRRPGSWGQSGEWHTARPRLLPGGKLPRGLASSLMGSVCFGSILASLCSSNRTPETGYYVNSKHLFLTVLEAGKSKTKVLAGKGLLTHPPMTEPGNLTSMEVGAKLKGGPQLFPSSPFYKALIHLWGCKAFITWPLPPKVLPTSKYDHNGD